MRVAGAALALLVAVTASASPRPRLVDDDQVREVRLLSAAHLPREVLVVLSEWTGDEVQSLLDTLRFVNRREGLAGDDRVKLRVILQEPDASRDLDLEDLEVAGLLIPEVGYLTDDLWMQDFGEFGMVRIRRAGPEVPAILDTGRERGLLGFPGYLADRFGARLVRVPLGEGDGAPEPLEDERDGDYGGNIEVTPDGLLVLGNTTSPALREFFAEGGYAESMVLLDTEWLDVGHVDEYVSFLPAPESELGYAVVRSDPLLGLRLLRGLSKEALEADLEGMAEVAFGSAGQFPDVLEQDEEVFETTYGEVAVLHERLRTESIHTLPGEGEELVDPADTLAANRFAAVFLDAALGDLYRAIRARHPNPEVPITELRFPSLFQSKEAGGLGALVPEPVNLLVLGRTLVVPDPLLAVFRDAIRKEAEGAGYAVRFLPSLTYHEGQGQVHCATQVLRDPARTHHPRYQPTDRLQVRRKLPPYRRPSKRGD